MVIYSLNLWLLKKGENKNKNKIKQASNTLTYTLHHLLFALFIATLTKISSGLQLAIETVNAVYPDTAPLHPGIQTRRINSDLKMDSSTTIHVLSHY